MKSANFVSNHFSHFLGDQGPTKQEEGLFKISDLKSAKDVELAIDQAGDNVAADADSEDEDLKPKAKLVKYSKDKGVLEEDLQYKEEKEVNSKYLNSTEISFFLPYFLIWKL